MNSLTKRRKNETESEVNWQKGSKKAEGIIRICRFVNQIIDVSSEPWRIWEIYAKFLSLSSFLLLWDKSIRAYGWFNSVMETCTHAAFVTAGTIAVQKLSKKTIKNAAKRTAMVAINRFAPHGMKNTMKRTALVGINRFARYIPLPAIKVAFLAYDVYSIYSAVSSVVNDSEDA